MQMTDDEESPFEPRKILVCDLAPNTTQDHLNLYFTQFGDVVEAIIPLNSVTGSPHSFGFVVFRHPLRIPFILQLPHCIHDRCVEVSRALKGEDLQTLESQRMTSTGDDFERLGNFDQRRISLEGSPRPGISNDEFLKYFQGFGNVIDCYFWNVIGFGQVTFRIKRGANRVLYRRSYILNGKRFKAKWWTRIQKEAAASSVGDHVNATKDMQPQAAKSVSNTIYKQSIPSSHSDHQPNNPKRRNRRVSNTRDMQIVLAAPSSGTDHVNSTRDMQPQVVESVSHNRDMQIIPAAANSDPRNMQIIPAAASFCTGHPWNDSSDSHRWRNNPNVVHISASGRTNLPPSYESILYNHPRMNYMVPAGVLELHFPGLRPTLYQAYNRMGSYTNAANNFPCVVVANFPQNNAGYGNFPMALTDYSDQGFNDYYVS